MLILLVTLAILGVPRAGEAQAATKIPRIGFLSPRSPSDPETARRLEAFRQGLRDVGYVEGRNIAIESRSAEGAPERLPGLAAELVRLKVDVIVTYGLLAIQAAKQATGTIPIVMVSVLDPVATGFVGSLARPGANITGIGLAALELAGKQLEILLKGAKPADLPVEQPTKFELVINVKTAKTLGLMIPRHVLLRADRIIDP